MEEEITDQLPVNPQNFKSGFVSIIGEPNAGKSTLLNSILGERLSIVTPKPQTTRKRILGIHTTEETQMVFLDTPGMIKPRYKLHESMIESIRLSTSETDAIVLMMDSEKLYHKTESLEQNLAFNLVKDLQTPLILALNKIDLIKKEDVLLLIDRLKTSYNFAEIVPLSAISGFNTSELLKALRAYLPGNTYFYSPDILSTAPERFFVSELVREKVFNFFSQEIPYSSEVIVEEFKENHLEDPSRKDLIRCAIIVETESQKKILIGKEGRAIKRVGQSARRDIEAFLGRKIFLELFVKVRENWRDKTNTLKSFGYK